MDEPILGTFGAEVETPEWNAFCILALVLLFAAIAGMFFWYYRRYHRRITIRDVDDIFRQQRPWVESLLILFGGVLALTVLSGLILVSNQGAAIGPELAWGAIFGLISVWLYWFLSLLWTLPPRVRFVPFLKTAPRRPVREAEK